MPGNDELFKLLDELDNTELRELLAELDGGPIHRNLGRDELLQEIRRTPNLASQRRRLTAAPLLRVQGQLAESGEKLKAQGEELFKRSGAIIERADRNEKRILGYGILVGGLAAAASAFGIFQSIQINDRASKVAEMDTKLQVQMDKFEELKKKLHAERQAESERTDKLVGILVGTRISKLEQQVTEFFIAQGPQLNIATRQLLSSMRDEEDFLDGLLGLDHDQYAYAIHPEKLRIIRDVARRAEEAAHLTEKNSEKKGGRFATTLSLWSDFDLDQYKSMQKGDLKFASLCKAFKFHQIGRYWMNEARSVRERGGDVVVYEKEAFKAFDDALGADPAFWRPHVDRATLYALQALNELLGLPLTDTVNEGERAKRLKNVDQHLQNAEMELKKAATYASDSAGKFIIVNNTAWLLSIRQIAQDTQTERLKGGIRYLVEARERVHKATELLGEVAGFEGFRPYVAFTSLELTISEAIPLGRDALPVKWRSDKDIRDFVMAISKISPPFQKDAGGEAAGAHDVIADYLAKDDLGLKQNSYYLYCLDLVLRDLATPPTSPAAGQTEAELEAAWAKVKAMKEACQSMRRKGA